MASKLRARAIVLLLAALPLAGCLDASEDGQEGFLGPGLRATVPVRVPDEGQELRFSIGATDGEGGEARVSAYLMRSGDDERAFLDGEAFEPLRAHENVTGVEDAARLPAGEYVVGVACESRGCDYHVRVGVRRTLASVFG